MFDSARPHPSDRRHHRPPRHQGRTTHNDFDNLPGQLRRLLGRGGPGQGTVRRGEIRPLILGVLEARPMHGYEVIQELEARSGGRWRPSAGSVYPTLQQLTDEGLVTSEEVDGRRTYTLTESGRKAAEAASASQPTWDQAADESDVRQVAMEVVRAAMQVQSVGSDGARREATQLLTETRRRLYRILADDEAVETSTDDPAGPAS